MPCRRQVNDGQAAKLERDETPCFLQGKNLAAFIVGTAVLQYASAFKGGGLVRDLSVDSAHKFGPLSGCLSGKAGYGAFGRARNSVARFREVILEGAKRVALQQRAKTVFRAVQVGVMAETGFERTANPRLAGIDLPGMEVKHQRPACAFELSKNPVGVGQWEYPEVSAARRREGHAGNSCGRRRELQQTLPIAQDVRIRIAACARRPVEIMADGIDAGVVCEA